MWTARGFEPLPPPLGATASAQEYKAQQARVYRIGVLLQGGPYYAAIDGLLSAIGWTIVRFGTLKNRRASAR